MPVSIGGMASGMDTEGIIKKLVEVEAQPIKRWTDERDTSKRRKEALGELKTQLLKINEAARDLYGFRASYNEKKASSSNQSILEATANKIADKGTRELKVKEIASAYKISSDKIKKDEKLPAGIFKIEVNGESRNIKFKGGKLDAFRDKIAEIASDLVIATYIKTDSDNYILTIESKVSGKKGRILLSGDKDFLKKIGLVKGEVGEKQEKVSLVFDRKYFVPYEGENKIENQDGNIDVSNDGKSVQIRGVLWREYVLPAAALIKKDTIFTVNIDYEKEPAEQDESVPLRVEIGPDEEITIKGIKLKGYNVPRIRPEEKKDAKKETKNITGIGVVSIENGKRIEKIYERGKDVKGKQVLPIGSDFDGKSVSSIIFYSNEGNVKFSEANIATPVKGTGLLEAKNILKEATDAVIDLDGVEITRDKNNDLNDIIKGVNLNLKRSSTEPVTLRIDPDIDKSVDKIKKFVKAYNDYLEMNIKFTKTTTITKPGDFDNSESGLFVGDMTILRLENSLKTTIGSAYPGRTENPIKTLPQTGVSTGEVNAAWESIKEGKLIINEEKLRNVIDNNPEGISEFFGSDTDGDNRVDNGMALRTESVLKPYISSGKSVLAARVDSEDEAIRSADNRIDRHKEHLKKYEDKLRVKFSIMEKSVSESKSQGNWLKMNTEGGK